MIKCFMIVFTHEINLDMRTSNPVSLNSAIVLGKTSCNVVCRQAAGLVTSVKKQLFGVSVLSRSQQHEDCARSLSAVLFHGPESLKSCCLSRDAAPPVLSQ
ncbi:hypothetical protein Cadr_000008878 [Camelus dromedarius]|uniref:Uncharacterized protein n=1 Tax=Camelus dromedarius TaxID=9838 RepID=A0A5N4DJ80_CAMDR|nr:hypothetical protein Cadr_000008878 [Camelus dromedarius]